MDPITDARRLLFLRTDRLGETLLTLPAVAALKAGLPQAAVTLAVHPALQPLLATAGLADEVMAWPLSPAGLWWGDAIRLARAIRPARFDLAIVSNPKKSSHLAVWLARVPSRVGYDRKWGGCLTHRVQDRKALGERHEVEYNLDLIRTLGLSVAIPSWRWPRLEHERGRVLQLLERQGIKLTEPFLAVHPWSSNPIKQWPLERYQRLIRQVVEQLGVQVVVVGGPEEQGKAPHRALEGRSAADLVGQLTLPQLAALLQEASLVVSNDSGPMHLAAAVGTPTVALFGTPSASTGPRRWGPWGEGHVVIWKSSMTEITVDEVFAAVQGRLHHRADRSQVG